MEQDDAKQPLSCLYSNEQFHEHWLQRATIDSVAVEFACANPGVHLSTLSSTVAEQLVGGDLTGVASMYFGSTPLASNAFALAGPMGDGRCITVGQTQRGDEVQLKGVPTPLTEPPKDGQASLPELLKEHATAEFLHRLGVVSSRTCSILTCTGQKLRRKKPFQAAVVSRRAISLRVAPTFVRVGTFEYLFHHRDACTMLALVHQLASQQEPESGTIRGTVSEPPVRGPASEVGGELSNDQHWCEWFHGAQEPPICKALRNYR